MSRKYNPPKKKKSQPRMAVSQAQSPKAAPAAAPTIELSMAPPAASAKNAAVPAISDAARYASVAHEMRRVIILTAINPCHNDSFVANSKISIFNVSAWK